MRPAAPVLAVLLTLAALPAAAQPVACAPGERVEVVENGTPTAATVRDGPRDGQCLVSYDDYGASWDEWVSLPAIAPLGATAAAGLVHCTKKARVEVRDYSSWYAATVIAYPRDGTCLIRYEGFEATEDEWVTGDRIRALPPPPEPPPLAPLSAELPAGPYICQAGFQILHAFTFQALPGGRYANAQGADPGTYAIDAVARTITFKGGHLGGATFDMTDDRSFAIKGATGYVEGICGLSS